MIEAPTWIRTHQQVWDNKPTLRAYYVEEYFARVLARMGPGPSLELGAGPGLFCAHHRCEVVTDVTPLPWIDVCADVHSLPFLDGAFGNVVGIDVLHHFAHPARALAELARVLKPGGRLILIEPWTGLFATFFYRYVHHEGCEALRDPWGAAFAADKDAMEGNATIPKVMLHDLAADLGEHGISLKVDEVEAFGSLAFLLTGGFQSWGGPSSLVGGLRRLERRLSQRVLRCIGTKALFVARRT